ncbi:secretogranin-3 isoform X1 [Seriola lalandi dorsalis]|uniref:secretogranin-3 isoform X1 n=1 Tax=Seriola lalandi dorsalis TaxID=1841481 RepID=UPI000C6F6356|nr:secretogranin-3 isoform X1 [Seriola lalandi dorsalis]XP_056228810.1 secretogranin-3 isoform X1 [Seriola aureovittata]
MASKYVGLFVLFQLLALNVVSQISAFPTPTASTDDKTVYNRQLTEERPLQEQIAEADSVKAAVQSAESRRPTAAKDTEPEQDSDDLTVLKSLAEGQKSKGNAEVPVKNEDQYVPDESDSTKSRRLAEDYDSTKNGMDDGKYQDDPESFRQVDGTPLTAEDIVQKIANKIYEEDDRGVFDRIVSKLLKLGLITDSQADTLEYQVAEALQDLITKNAKNNEIEDLETNDQDTEGEQDDQGSDANTDTWEPPRRRYNEDEEDEEEDDDVIEDEVDRDAEEDGGDAADNTWDKDTEEGNEVSPEDGLQDLQYFPNFYRLLRSLNSDQDTQERETLITIMKTLIDFVKMMVKYGTITPEEGVSYLENLDAMIAMQTKNKLGKSLGPPDFAGLTGKNLDEDDNTKAEAAKMQKEYENLKDSTKEQPSAETNGPGKSETYLEAIRKNIEWLKKHNKEEGKDDYDLSKLKDFMDQQVDSYIEKGIIAKDEGDTIKRIYSSL